MSAGGARVRGARLLLSGRRGVVHTQSCLELHEGTAAAPPGAAPALDCPSEVARPFTGPTPVRCLRGRTCDDVGVRVCVRVCGGLRRACSPRRLMSVERARALLAGMSLESSPDAAADLPEQQQLGGPRMTLALPELTPHYAAIAAEVRHAAEVSAVVMAGARAAAVVTTRPIRRGKCCVCGGGGGMGYDTAATQAPCSPLPRRRQRAMGRARHTSGPLCDACRERLRWGLSKQPVDDVVQIIQIIWYRSAAGPDARICI